MSKTKAFVSLSGGIDSSTCLGFAVRDVGAANVTAISIDYGQRHMRETEQAKLVCAHFGVKHEMHKIEGIPKSMLTDTSIEVPNMSYAEVVGVSPTYVPFRNGQILSKLAGIASSRIADDENGLIYFGAHAEDAAGDAYPDCRMDFIGAMAAAIYIGTYHKVRVKAPLIEMFKDEIILAGHKLGVPFELTWSCYKGEALQCGQCMTCRARKDGFKRAMVMDPTEYATTDTGYVAHHPV